MRYALHRLTGATLTNGAPESAGVVSRHRTKAGAERAADIYRRACPLGARVEVREVRAAHRPRHDPSAARVARSYRLHPDTIARIDAEAKRTGQSAGQVVDVVVANQIARI